MYSASTRHPYNGNYHVRNRRHCLTSSSGSQALGKRARRGTGQWHILQAWNAALTLCLLKAPPAKHTMLILSTTYLLGANMHLIVFIDTVQEHQPGMT